MKRFLSLLSAIAFVTAVSFGGIGCDKGHSTGTAAKPSGTKPATDTGKAVDTSKTPPPPPPDKGGDKDKPAPPPDKGGDKDKDKGDGK